jgi:phage terminase large subunit GpA-like protein
MSLLCRLCGERIKFDDKHISGRTGKRIPLDVGTEEAHDCPARREQQQQQPEQRRYHQCNKGCGQEIYFDANNKSQSGKWIPLDKDTGEPHQCPQ